MKGRRWAGGKWGTKETQRLIYQIVSIAWRKRKEGAGGEEESLTRPERLMKRGASKKKTSAVAEGRKL